jgi:dipeptidyl aminopeptidase/acylaminoacyl peptidase
MSNPNPKRPFELKDLFRFQCAAEAALSPDGSQVVYSLLSIDAEKEEEHSALWLVSVANGESRRLTAGTARDSCPQWSPDGKTIAFLSTREGGVAQIYLLPIAGGEAFPLTYLKQGLGGFPVWSPDGTLIAFTAGPVDPPDLSKPYRLKRSSYRFDGFGYIDPLLQQLYIIPSAGGEAKQLTHSENQAGMPSWSPDGKEILFQSGFDPASHNFTPSLKICNLEGETRLLLSNEWGLFGNAVWLPDGRIAFSAAPAGTQYGTKSDLWVMDREGKNITCRTGGLKVGVGGLLHDDFNAPWMFSPTPILVGKDCKDAVIHVQAGGEVHLYRIDLDGAETWAPLASGERTCFPLSRVGDQLLFGVSRLDDPTQLCLVNVDGSDEKQLTSLNKDLHETIDWPCVQHLNFRGSDGKPVEGWILKPTQGKAPYPTILHIHGGPHAGYGHIFSFDFQTLAGAGYAVLFINHRGSTGYGSDFANQIIGDWGNLDYNDLMAGVDHAIAEGIVDGERMGCCGVSGGGNLSCWIIGHTNRFKAAAPENPVTNWLSFYGVSDIGPFFSERELGGKPHEIPDIYRKCSPISYAHNCKTPTLLFQGESDYRCPAEQSEQFYTVLKANGCTVEMVRFPNSPHNGASTGAPAVRRVHNEALLEWMDRWVKGKGQ